jgi:hypothetical protein
MPGHRFASTTESTVHEPEEFQMHDERSDRDTDRADLAPDDGTVHSTTSDGRPGVG